MHALSFLLMAAAFVSAVTLGSLWIAMAILTAAIPGNGKRTLSIGPWQIVPALLIASIVAYFV